MLILLLLIKFRSEFFLADYINKLGNFNQPYVETAFALEGYYDNYNYDISTLSTSKAVIDKRQLGYHVNTSTSGKSSHIYEFVMIPNIGFLGDPTPLLNNCELKLNFDRSPAACAIMSSQEVEAPYLEIKDCHAVTEWVSSANLKNYFAQIEYNPISYRYDEIEVLCKPLPMGTKNLRLDNLRGGNIPSYIFAGIIATDAINGDLALSSTNFACHNVTDINITLNGNSVTGYPMEIKNCSDTNAMFQFNDTIGRTYNNKCCAGLKKAHFYSNYIWAHRFEAEETAQGWIGIDIKVSEPFTSSYTMVIWLIYETSFTIDKYHQVERF